MSTTAYGVILNRNIREDIENSPRTYYIIINVKSLSVYNTV